MCFQNKVQLEERERGRDREREKRQIKGGREGEIRNYRKSKEDSYDLWMKVEEATHTHTHRCTENQIKFYVIILL